jgi:hypothetical protein
LGTSNSADLTIDSAGNVGIGDTTPEYKLDVTGTGRFTSSLYADSNLYMSDTNVYDANIVQANTLEDPEDSTLYINDWLLIGNALEVGGSDIKVGTMDSRNEGSNTNQRALVHWEQDGFIENPNSNDTLVMNFWGDFEGGVRVHGPGLIVDGNLQIGKRGATVFNWSGGFLSKGYAENTTSDCDDSSDSGRIRIAPYSAGDREAFCVCLREALNEYAWFCLVATDS